ncbi:MAG TPA: hypothetical protein OIM43_12815 [Prevotellaceae bacterium]|nr:hypothetical protein [Prevotellaceae bacterium]
MGEYNNNLRINIPRFISISNEINEEDAIFKIKTEDLIEDAKEFIAKFNHKNQQPIITDKRSKKTTKLGIKNINVIDIKFNEDKALILQVSTYKTNLIDGYYQKMKDQKSKENEIQFDINDRIGSNTYFFVLYPIVKKNIEKLTCQRYWHVFIYVDPSKEINDMKMVARYIMSSIIKYPIKNIKAQKFIEELRKQKIIESAEITLSSYDDSDDEEQPGYLSKYTICCKIKKHKTITVKRMSVEDAIAAYEDKSFKEKYSKRQLKFFNSNQQVYQAVQEFHEKITESFENSFNYVVDISAKDINNGNIFETSFIKKTIESLLVKYTLDN